MADRRPTHAHFAGNLREWPLSDLQAARKSVAELVASEGWSHVLKLLKQREESLLDQIVAGGRLLSQGQYAAVCGEINGLRQCADSAATLLTIASEMETREKARFESERQGDENG